MTGWLALLAFYVLFRPSGSGDITTIHSLYTTRFDKIFKEYGRGIPVPYLRALCKNESDFNPNNQEGPAWGLMQVVEVVRESYNKRFKTSYVREDLLNPIINVKIASELIARIADTLPKNHPSVLTKNWSDPNFVSIVTFGWNAGYSEAAGVGYVLGNMTERATLDRVYRRALELPRAAKTLKMADKVTWCKKVTTNYFEQITRTVPFVG